MIQNIQQYPLRSEDELKGAPQFCPVTGRQFWGYVTHPELGEVPTYGGPFDTYTIPEKDEDGEWETWRCDQDDDMRWHLEAVA